MNHYRYLTALAAVSFLFLTSAPAQINSFPYFESFDTLSPPALPDGWTSSQNRTVGVNDFTSTTSSTLSSPNALISTNATIEQMLLSPVFSFLIVLPDSLSFFTRRSSTHLAAVVVEASLDNGATFPLQLGDTLYNPGPAEYFRTAFLLPETLSTSQDVFFRWRVIPDSSGTTGTFRIDDVTITARSMDDLALSAIHFTPLFPTTKDVIFAGSTVTNAGLRSSSQFIVEFFLDMNADSVAQISELIASTSNTEPINPGDSAEISMKAGSLSVGSYTVIARVDYDLDQNSSNDALLQTLVVGYPLFSVVINEIMYAPTGSEPEWVELHNTTTDSLDIREWQVSDLSASGRVTLTSTSVHIPSEGYLVVTDDSAALLDIHPGIPAPILNVPGLPAFNNSGDAVVLFDQRGALMDSVLYAPAWGGSGGKSLERVEPSGPSLDSTNWMSSTNPAGSSPGLKNSVTRKDHDLSLSGMLFNPAFPVAGDTVVVTAKVLNAGTTSALGFSVELYEDVNADSAANQSELLSNLSWFGTHLPSDSLDFSFELSPVENGERLLMAKVCYETDEDTTNNIRLMTLSVGVATGSVVINEIMYAPSSDGPEWIELLNALQDSVDIKNWRVGNRNIDNRYDLPLESVSLAPGQLVVITKDSALLRSVYSSLIPEQILQVASLPTFLWNNGGDAVVLSDQRGGLMDSLFYSTTWGGADGLSLERIDPQSPAPDSANWSSSVDSTGATPGRPNSLVVLEHDLKIASLTGANVASGSFADLSIVIVNVGKETSGQFSVALYNDLNHDSTASPEELTIDSTLTSALAYRESLHVFIRWRNPPSGTHEVIAILDYSKDMRPSNNTIAGLVHVGFSAGSLVVNEIMFAPLASHAEYIELYNGGESDVDISGWSVSDRPGSDGSSNETGLAHISQNIRSGEFFTVASDSSVFDLFPNLRTRTAGLVSISNDELSLNNDGDLILLRDQTGEVIDSLDYLPFWHNPGVHDQTGRSLEKINPHLRGSDARSWSTCAKLEGGTPGEQNSIYAVSVPTNSKLSFSPNPFSPDGDSSGAFLPDHAPD